MSISKFVTAFDSLASQISNLTPGENGMLENKSTHSALLNLFFKLIRNLPQDNLKENVNDILLTVKTTNDANLLADLFVMTFQTRDCRGGKGEKMLFNIILLELFKECPNTVISLLGEISHFGYFKDFLNLIDMIVPLKSSLVLTNATTDPYDTQLLKSRCEYDNLHRLQNAIIDLYAAQLLKDKKELDSSKGTPVLSFAAKFAPRQGKKFKQAYIKLVKNLFGKSRTPDEEYRKLIVPLTEALKIPEVLMCANRYDEINFKNVPSLCLNRCRKAFLNELVTINDSYSAPLSPSEQETGNRYPDDPKRVACRKNLLLATIEGKVCGKVLQPHELVSHLINNSSISSVESSVYDAQWQKIKEGVLEGIEKMVSESQSSAINLGKLVPLVDVSGSMVGIPMMVAIALGILVSELSMLAFRNRFITFKNNPQWINLEGLTSLKDKVLKTKASPWGGSTNFTAALELILKVAIDNRLSPEEIPDLIVFSDMQFNQADRKGETMHEHIKRRFSEAGVQICGKPYPAPKIIYWNLRGDTYGHPVLKDTPNTQMLSGFSPSLLKLVLNGEPLVVEEIAADGTVNQRQVTPEETLRKALDDERYNIIRMILSQSEEGVLSNYTFTPFDEDN